MLTNMSTHKEKSSDLPGKNAIFIERELELLVRENRVECMCGWKENPNMPRFDIYCDYCDRHHGKSH
jgi:hypothetical protein